MSELLLSPKEGWCRIKWNLYTKAQRPGKRATFWEKGLIPLPEGEWAVAESQREMTQHEVTIVYQDAMPWKTSIFLRGRVELFTGGWVSYCWVPKRDDAGWSENCMPSCNALKKGQLSERKGEWAGAEWCRREWEEWLQDRRRKYKKESISILLMQLNL